MACIQHVLLSTFFTLEMLATHQAMSFLNLFPYSSGEFFNIGALISKWREIMGLKHVFFWERSWTEQALVFLSFFLSNNWELGAWRCLTSLITLGCLAGVISQFSTVIFVFLWIKMLLVCLRWKELFRAQFTMKFILGTTFRA